MMEEMIKEQDAVAAAEAAKKAAQVVAKAAVKPSNGNSAEAAGSKCPFSGAVEKSEGNTELYLNEVGLMQQFESRKKPN